MKITKRETIHVKPRWLFLKVHMDEGIVGLGEPIVEEPFKVVDGYVALPAKPGLGIELDDNAVAEKIFTGDWETPALRHPDGSVADW